MEISRDGSHWGEIQIDEAETQVRFHANGLLPKYGEILRVWGMRKGAQPLLIGVAEPAGDGLQVERTMSKQYLKSLDYWPELPEWYMAGIQPPKEKERVRESYLHALCRNAAVTCNRTDERAVFTCRFAKDQEFPFAFAFSCCTVKDACAQLVWDEKKDCPVWTVPESYDIVI